MNVSMEDRVSVLENRVANVSNLAATTAKGVGKDRSQRQMVVFATGEFKQRLLELLEKWVAGAQAAKASTTPSETTILPFKLQVVQAVVAQLENQGLTGEILSTLKMRLVSIRTPPQKQIRPGFSMSCFPVPRKAWLFAVCSIGLRSSCWWPKTRLLGSSHPVVCVQLVLCRVLFFVRFCRMWVTLRNKLKVGSREKVRVPKVLLPEKDLLTDGVLRSPGMTAARLKGKRCLVAHLVSYFSSY